MGQPVRGVLELGAYERLVCALPGTEGKDGVVKGGKYIVYVYIDEESYRIVASAKVEHFLSKERPEYETGEEVDVLVWQRTDLGYKVIVDNKFRFGLQGDCG